MVIELIFSLHGLAVSGGARDHHNLCLLRTGHENRALKIDKELPMLLAMILSKILLEKRKEKDLLAILRSRFMSLLAFWGNSCVLPHFWPPFQTFLASGGETTFVQLLRKDVLILSSPMAFYTFNTGKNKAILLVT